MSGEAGRIHLSMLGTKRSSGKRRRGTHRRDAESSEVESESGEGELLDRRRWVAYFLGHGPLSR
jgi:hypothetical protein